MWLVCAETGGKYFKRSYSTRVIVDWIQLADNVVQWRDLVNTAINLRFP